LDYEKATDMMETAASKIDQAWKFSLAAVVIMCSEALLPFVVVCCASCCKTSGSSRGTVLVYGKEAANAYDYTGADESNEDKLVSDEKKEFNPVMLPPVDGTPLSDYTPPQQPYYGTPQ
jgi:hypothetical protein